MPISQSGADTTTPVAEPLVDAGPSVVAPVVDAGPSSRVVAPAAPEPRFPPGPPPPAEIKGEAPCKTDADCVVEHTRSCCGCTGITVRSHLKKPERPPECGCRDYSMEQLMPGGGGGHCGPMPPPAGDYRAVCREQVCVGLHR
jgi:hypothetical protein